jgi:phosphoribosylanthranilate isomerase
MILKICGITRVEDAEHAAAHGATAVGLVFWPGSPRFVTARQAAAITAALPPGVMSVGVFVNETVDAIRRAVDEAGLTTVQLHGDEPPEYADALQIAVLRSTTIERADEAAARWGAGTTLLLDAADPVRRGGTGVRVDWARAADVARRHRIVLAGGLAPGNVEAAVAAVRPFGLDVSSGVESAPGIKDRDKVRRFLEQARDALAGHARSARP